jgi:hypothetical protein
VVIAGHVHNYQRLTRTLPDGTQWPYLVIGAGGYHNLHSIQKVNGKAMIAPVTFETDPDGDPITLETYLDDHHGFLRLTVDSSTIVGGYYQVPRPQEPRSKGNQLVDYFEYDWHTKKYVPNKL